MNIYEVNRNTVQRRLDIRKAQREEAQRTAQQEAADAAFRAEINKHTQARRAEKEAAEEAQRRKEERRAAEARKQKWMADKENRYCRYWLLYAFLTILPLLIATILIVVHAFGYLPIWILVPSGIACCAFSVFTFVDLAPWIDRETMNRFTTTFQRKLRAYLYTPYSKLIR